MRIYLWNSECYIHTDTTLEGIMTPSMMQSAEGKHVGEQRHLHLPAYAPTHDVGDEAQLPWVSILALLVLVTLFIALLL